MSLRADQMVAQVCVDLMRKLAVIELHSEIVEDDLVPCLGRDQLHEAVRLGGEVFGDDLAVALKVGFLGITLADVLEEDAEQTSREQAQTEFSDRPRAEPRGALRGGVSVRQEYQPRASHGTDDSEKDELRAIKALERAEHLCDLDEQDHSIMICYYLAISPKAANIRTFTLNSPDP